MLGAAAWGAERALAPSERVATAGMLAVIGLLGVGFYVAMLRMLPKGPRGARPRSNRPIPISPSSCETAIRVVVAVAVIASGVVAGAAGATDAATSKPASVDRVLVISLPAVSWADVEAGAAPNLQALLARSAVADLVTRVAGRRSSMRRAGTPTLGRAVVRRR